MQIVIKANPSQKLAFLQMPLPDSVKLHWVDDNLAQPGFFLQTADAYIDCCYEAEGYSFAQIQQQPVFVNAVIDCCKQLPKNAIRFNAWEGFIARPIWEIATSSPEMKAPAEKVVLALCKEFAWVPDQPGLIAARVIAMIINEAYYALGDGVSSKSAIDTAMKLGTNYPWGPFEWGEKMGLSHVIALLKELAVSNNRYQPAPKLLEAQANTRHQLM